MVQPFDDAKYWVESLTHWPLSALMPVWTAIRYSCFNTTNAIWKKMTLTCWSNALIFNSCLFKWKLISPQYHSPSAAVQNHHIPMYKHSRAFQSFTGNHVRITRLWWRHEWSCLEDARPMRVIFEIYQILHCGGYLGYYYNLLTNALSTQGALINPVSSGFNLIAPISTMIFFFTGACFTISTWSSIAGQLKN